MAHLGMYDGIEYDNIATYELCMKHQKWFYASDYGCPLCKKQIFQAYCERHNIYYTTAYGECPYCVDESLYCITTN